MVLPAKRMKEDSARKRLLFPTENSKRICRTAADRADLSDLHLRDAVWSADTRSGSNHSVSSNGSSFDGSPPKNDGILSADYGDSDAAGKDDAQTMEDRRPLEEAQMSETHVNEDFLARNLILPQSPVSSPERIEDTPCYEEDERIYYDSEEDEYRTENGCVVHGGCSSRVDDVSEFRGDRHRAVNERMTDVPIALPPAGPARILPPPRRAACSPGVRKPRVPLRSRPAAPVDLPQHSSSSTAHFSPPPYVPVPFSVVRERKKKSRRA